MAYTRLLRAYYHAERAIPEGQQYRLAKASTPAQRKAVDAVLAEFFTLTDGAFHQKRADAEIDRYQDKQRKAKASANARWSQSERNANASPNAMRTHSEGNALQTPDTRHQTPEEKKAPRAARTASPKKSAIPDDFTVSDRVRDWAASNGHGQLTRHLEHFRSACKAKGYTYVDWDEAFMGAIRKDWAGLNAPQARASPNAKPSPAEQRVAFMAELTGRSPQQSTSEVIDVEFRSTAPRLG
jgi:uncharacterized protein YdaU (DUF1376 family)